MLIPSCICYISFQGGQLYSVPPNVACSGAGCSLVPVCLPWGVPCAVVGPVLSCFDAVRTLYRGGGGGCVGGESWFVMVWSAYLNSASPAPSSHCGLCTLILCAGTCDPRIHRCVARTKVIAILILMYPHVFE